MKVPLTSVEAMRGKLVELNQLLMEGNAIALKRVIRAVKISGNEMQKSVIKLEKALSRLENVRRSFAVETHILDAKPSHDPGDPNGKH